MTVVSYKPGADIGDVKLGILPENQSNLPISDVKPGRISRFVLLGDLIAHGQSGMEQWLRRRTRASMAKAA